jgi:molecular chaperone DnaJ
MSTHYQTLGVDPGASLDEIKEAHRRLVKLWHPDANLDDRDDEDI